ncbi:BTAD domain-containing putative transcriptional regulator [Nocardioides sp. MH1]|uniref:AfsR/SARP family transcriptional regulator n=1 Tax=Nocardioides sp. MH1 TaxID=3242490 RepID=UPI0035230DC2
MDIRLLGPFEVESRGGPVALGGPRQRAVVAVAALAAPDVVSTDRLVDAIWGERPPANPLPTLQVFVSKLRKALAAAGEDGVLESRAPGYRLRIDVGDTDVGRFEERTATARSHREADPAAALAAYDEALALWRGPFLSDLLDLPFVESEAARLEELRLLAVEQRTDVALRLGRHAEVVAGLEELVRLHPTREVLWGHLMTALYRSDRQADALQAYGRAREQLAEELGIDPGQALRQLELAILQQAPSLAAPVGETAATAATSATAAVSPPADPTPRVAARPPRLTTRTFGRDDLVAEVVERLGVARLVSLTGMGGSGKSRLATVVAHELAGAGRPVVFLPITEATTPERLHADIAEALAEGGTRDPLDALADRDDVVVLDNLESMPTAPEAVAALIERTALTVLVTTRLALGLLAEEELPVPPLAVPTEDASVEDIVAAAAVAMFADRASAAARAAGRSFRLAGNERAVARLCRVLDGLPLALELAAARVKLLGVERLLAALPESLAVLTTTAADVPERHRALEQTIAWSYERLDDDTRLMCDRLALFEGGFTLDALEAVCPDVPQVIDMVAAISDARLVTAVESRVEVRFAMLGTVRAFAHRRLAAHPDLDDRRQRLAAHLADQVEVWSREVDGVDGLLALGRFADEAADVEAAVGRALDAGDAQAAVRLVHGAAELWVASGRLSTGVALAARVCALAPDSAAAWLVAGQLAYHLTEWDEARAACERALALGAPDDVRLRAAASCYLAGALAITGEFAEAERQAAAALGLARDHDLYPQVAVALAMSAIAQGVQGHFDREAALHQERLAVVRRHGDITRVADTLNTLAEIALDEADVDTAAAYATEAQAMAGTSRVPEARDARITGARALVGRGDLGAAATMLREALVLADRTRQRLARAQCFRVAGAIAMATSRPDDAIRLFAAAEAVSPAPGGGGEPVEQDLAAALAAARAAVGDAAANRAWTLGGLASAETTEGLVADVLSATSPVGA